MTTKQRGQRRKANENHKLAYGSMPGEDIARAFQKAVEKGDVDIATTLAAQLATQKAKVQLKCDKFNPGKIISITVKVEDRCEQSAGFKLKVPATSTFYQLKTEVNKLHRFPPEIQRWIVGRNLPQDTQTLEGAGVKDGWTLYLYLVSKDSLKDGDARTQPARAPEVPQQQQAPRQQQAPTQRGAEGGRVTARPPPPVMEPERPKWECRTCTYRNELYRPGCEQCSTSRPDDVVIPPGYKASPTELRFVQGQDLAEQEFRKHQQREEQTKRRAAERAYREHVQIEGQGLVLNTEVIECVICMTEVEPGEGMTLHGCLHAFCLECLRNHVHHSEDAEVACPYVDGAVACNEPLQDREIKALVPPAEYERYLRLGLHQAENRAQDSFHCQTADCQGFCFFADDVNFFPCPVCKKKNCITCKAQHEGMNCKEYQDDIKRRAGNDLAAQATAEALEQMLRDGEAMKCPQCGIIVMKKAGCDWMQCTMCKCEICWATRGPRWGPGGHGDASGGCKCQLGVRPCHPNCGNCH